MRTTRSATTRPRWSRIRIRAGARCASGDAGVRARARGHHLMSGERESAVSVEWNPADPIAPWLALGRENRWIRRAVDPRFNRESFTRCADAEELKRRLAHGN